MAEHRRPGRPRKWNSDAERMRARRASQRADRERFGEEQRAKVLDGTPVLDPDEAARLVADFPRDDTVKSLEKLINLLMIACQVEGGIHEWLHQACRQEYDEVLTKYHDEQEFVKELMAEAKSVDRLNCRMRIRLEEVDPDGPFKVPTFVTERYPELKEM